MDHTTLPSPDVTERFVVMQMSKLAKGRRRYRSGLLGFDAERVSLLTSLLLAFDWGAG